MRHAHISDDTGAYAFRRSRTMTGSSSDTVRAAAELHADLQSDRLKHHVLRKKRRHISVYLAVVLACAGSLTLMLNTFISSVVMTNRTADDVSYQQTINKYLAAYPSERFSFALREDALLAVIQDKHPEVRTVAITAQPWLQPAQATIGLRTPIASWTIGATKYYIDNNGVAFQKNTAAEPSLVVEDNTGIDPTSTGAVASERMLRYIGRLVALLQQKGLIVERLELPPSTSRQVDVRLEGKSYIIKTNLDRDPAGQVADIVEAVQFLTTKGITPAYADVRVSSKLYYK